MIGFEISIEVKNEKRREFLQSFEMFSRIPFEHNDCIKRMLFESVTMPNSFLWVEYWNSENSLKSHMESDQFHGLMGAVDTLGELKEIQIVENVPAENWHKTKT